MDNRNKGVYIPLHEAARVYGYTRDHLGYLIRKGDLKGEKLGSFYFTTHEWVKNYVLKSGKARKEDERIKQKEITASDIGVSKNKVKRQIIKKAVYEFKKAIKPLILDISREGKKFIGNFTKLPDRFNNFVKTNTFRKQITGEIKLWREEARYYVNQFKKLNSNLEFSNLTIDPLRKVTGAVILLPKTSLEISFFIINNGAKEIKSSFKKIKVLAKKTQREIFWKISNRKLPTINHEKKANRHFATENMRIPISHQVLGPSFIFLGIFIFCLGILPIITPNQGWNGFLMAQLNSISNKVYLVADDLGVNDGLFYDRSIVKSLSERLSIIERREGVGGKEFRVNNEIFAELTRSANILIKKAGLFIENANIAIQGISKNLNKSLASLSDVSVKLISIKRKIENNTNKSLIAFETEMKDGINKGIKEIKGIKKILDRGVENLRRQMYAWQSLNNTKLAQIDNRLAQIKKMVLANISGGAREQVAQLKFNFDFITKSFQKIKNYFVYHSETEKQIGYLDERIKNLESQKVNDVENLAPVNQSQEGLIVIPSTKDDEQNKNKIKSMFSDEVVVEPDKTGQSGIIKPVFKKQTDQKYLYMLVPIGN
ncbi:MAG: hypothetical protein WC242_05245 [Candidatus Paceibacterota bacterium]|jgi:hypothetical protein